MPNQTIALLHPGEMGAAVGACLVARGLRVLWVSQGRSPATRARAQAAGLEQCETLDRALAAAAVVLSVCPPHGAVDLARAVAAKKNFRGIFVDANAIAPASAREIGRVIEAAGASFVDGGIIGPPPDAPGRTRLYLSGSAREQIVALFASTHVQAIALDGEIGAASALKMAYAAWTKGSTALVAAIRALAAGASRRRRRESRRGMEAVAAGAAAGIRRGPRQSAKSLALGRRDGRDRREFRGRRPAGRLSSRRSRDLRPPRRLQGCCRAAAARRSDRGAARRV